MKFWPQWTEKVVVEGAGRDPLGLSRVSDVLTEYLLPGIVTTTSRARYYSFYAWAISEVCERIKEAKQGVEFEDEFQKREAAFAMSSRLGRITGLTIVGIDEVERQLTAAAEDEVVDPRFRVLPSNATGGLGQYYGGCLQKMALAGGDEDGGWVIEDERGKKLSDAFRRSTAAAPYVTGGWASKARVPLDVVKRSSRLFSLDGIRTKQAEAERQLLIQIFFDLDKGAAGKGGGSSRQATLAQFLHISEAYRKLGASIPRKDAEASLLFWPHYYGDLDNGDGGSVPYESPPVFAENTRLWRQFCAHQFFAFAAEEFLQAAIDALSPFPEGLTKDELIERMVDHDLEKDLAEVTGRRCKSPWELLGFFGATDEPTRATSGKAASKFSTEHPLNEWAVVANWEGTPDTRLARAFVLLCQLYAKWWGLRDDEGYVAVDAVNPAQEWWLGSALQWGDTWRKEKHGWNEAISGLLGHVMNRHEEIRFQKRKLEASWLEFSSGRYRMQQDLRPQFRASRHPNMVTIFQDLGLLDDGDLDDPIQITTSGRNTLKEVMKARS
jgi:hypothetical protein